jgi:hypothetical protein
VSIAAKEWFLTAFQLVSSVFLFLKEGRPDARYQHPHPLMCSHSCHTFSLQHKNLCLCFTLQTTFWLSWTDGLLGRLGKHRSQHTCSGPAASFNSQIFAIPTVFTWWITFIKQGMGAHEILCLLGSELHPLLQCGSPKGVSKQKKDTPTQLR